ncbi:precorrin-3B C(17)-methyltransferase [Herbivorax sp. ANBcel31]|uniref:precorrin-3B C(17)-methyltransferase n=1 Tax=Herbivorax sp. ANBcel31 TaxID=3069754 RepID=UPI0027B0089B|nr:precorrin-3B C(17)-methyltransferase [Herbivorax sp. ANBcel31]MDQ2086951.1 precorrin-3B C(17)-methyltransferase [Herbivorax sp. ANBcel31]
MSKIYVVGMGPGSMEDMTPRAKKALGDSDYIAGYFRYIEYIKEHFPDKEFIESNMKKEVERCRAVLEKALEGYTVSLVSSGDSGIYGMAGLMLEVLKRSKAQISVEVIPGITAVSAAASLLGAPLMHDFSVISLSDLLTPLELIKKRIECAVKGDFVICFYNPKSKNRSNYINEARDIILRYKSGATPVGIVTNAGRAGESIVVTDLESMLSFEINMFTVVIVGNSKTYVENGRIITPRGYIF